MSTNIKHLNINDVKKICRICTLQCDIKIPPDNIILNVFYKLTDIHFETNVEFPQQICLKCFQKINEIQKFALECKEAHFTLTKCFENLQDVDQDVKDNPLEKSELEIFINEEITIDEHKIEFNDEELNNAKEELKIYQKILENSTNELNEKGENISCSIDSNIHVENEESNSSIEPNKDKCDVGNKYNCLTSVKMRKQLHDGERPFKCEQCSESFALSYRLKGHMLTHNDERPYKCQQCSKSFTQLSNLKKHMRMHSDERPFKCEQCSKSFFQPRHLREHIYTHSSERPHKCQKCPNSFIRLKSLKKHLRKHIYERPYKCDPCLKSFYRSDHLKKHLLMHCGEHP